MREQVELLEHHADIAAHRVDFAAAGGQLDAIHDDAAVLHGLEPIDAADQRGLARARWPAQDDAFPAPDPEVDRLEGVEGAVVFVHAFHQDGGLLGLRHRLTAP